MTRRLATRLKEKRDQLPERPEPGDLVLSELPATWTGRLGKQFKEAEASVGHPGLVPHDLAHAFGSSLARSRVPLPDIQRLMGHKTVRMTMRYAHHDAEERAIAAFEAHLGAGSDNSEEADGET